MDVEIRDQAGKAEFFAFNHAISQGEEIAAVTRVTGTDALPTAVVVKGTLEGKELERVLPVKNARLKAGALPRTWAKLEIDRLLADDAVKHKDTIIALSKAMYVMTPYTSLLVLENEDQYVQYRVDRGRKDHWALYPLAEKIPVIVEPDPDAPDAIEAKAGKLAPHKVLQTIAARGLAVSNGDDNKKKGGVVYSLGKSNLGLGRVQPVADLLVPLGTDWGGVPPNANGPLVLDLTVPREPSAPTQPPGLPSLSKAPYLDKLFRNAGWGTKEDAKYPPGLALKVLDPMVGAGPPPPAPAFLDVFGRPPSTTPDDGPSGGWRARGLMSEALKKLDRHTAYFDVAERQSATAEHAAKRNSVPLAWYELKPARDAKPQVEGDVFLDLVRQMQWMPERGPIYERPSYQPPAEVFHDLVAYAPGLNTSRADVLAVLDAEALPGAWNRAGKIAAGARDLLDQARLAGWHAFTMPAADGLPAFTVNFDGTGRFAFERVLPFGLRERVVCDGKMLTHLYPQLALAARRDASRFHRADLAALVPWFVPPAEELARGADLTLAGERTVAIVPHGVAAQKKDADGKEATHQVVHLLFGKDGKLAERRLVQMPAGKVLYRFTLAPGGTVRVLDGAGKELSVRQGKLVPSQAPPLVADTKDMLVMPLPLRTPEHVARTLKLDKRSPADLTLKEALPLFLAHVARGDGNAAQQLFTQVFFAREQRQLGFYVLLASCGVNLDSDHGNVLGEHLDQPLAQYLALHTSPVLRKHASQWAVGSGSWEDGFLQHLAVTHALLQRWQEAKVIKGDATRAEAEKRRALDYVRKNRDSRFGWAMLCLIQDRAEKDAALHGQLAELWPLFEENPDLRFAARYEQARSLWQADKMDAARQRFRALYETAVKDGALPAVDADLRNALLADDGWGTLMRQTARQLVEQKRRVAVLALARQCWDLDDQPLAGELLATAMDGIVDPAERTALALAAYDFLRETGQLPEADRLLQGLLADAKLARQSLLWWLGHTLAKQRDMPARAVECLEKALALEAEQPPDVIDLQATRTDHGALLEHYQSLADAMVALKLAPPPDFLSRVIRAADRWRAVDNDPAAVCQAAAKVLKRLGERELSWDYLTTPIALQPNEARPWWNLAVHLANQGELDLADRAYRAATEAEPTDAQMLWDRAQNLKQLGKHQEAQQLVRRIAEGSWQPRFQGLQAQARHLLKGG